MPLRLAQDLPHLQSLHPLPNCDGHPSNCCPSGGYQSGWFCVHSSMVQALQTASPKRPAVSSDTPTSTGVYSQKLQGCFCWHCKPGLSGLARGWDSLLPRYPSWFYPPHMNVGPPVRLATLPPPPCHHHTVSSIPWLTVSTPPTHLVLYGFFKALVVGFPYSSIFWQLSLFLNLFLSFFWFCVEAKYSYLHLHLGWKLWFIHNLILY